MPRLPCSIALTLLGLVGGMPSLAHADDASDAARKEALAAITNNRGAIEFEGGRAGTPVKRITFGCQGNCTPELVAHLASLPELRSLSFRASDSIQAKDLAPLKQLANLEAITAHHMPLGDECLETLKDLPNLKSISLMHLRGFRGEGLAHLAAMPRLESVRIVGATVSDQTLIHLGKLTKVNELSIVNSQVTGSLEEHLKGMTNLRTLCLRQTKVSPESIRALQTALPDLKITQ